MTSEKKAIEQALGTTKILEEQLKPFFHENAKTLVAPIQQFLENHLALAEREELNSKLTPEIIKENILKEEQATLEAAKRRMDERKQRREDAKAEAEKDVIAQAKADKKGKAKSKGKVLDLGSAKLTDLGGDDNAQKESNGAPELSEEQKASLVDQPKGEPEEGLNEEEKALLGADLKSGESKESTSNDNTEDVEKKPEKKSQTKKEVTSAQEPLI